MGPSVKPSIAVVVEDDPDIRDLAAALLEETDLDVVTCESAEAAVSILQDRGAEVAMLFTDVRLAGSMDGLSLARVVGQLWPGVRVVVTSGYGDAGRLPERAVYMDKPWRALDVLVQADWATRAPHPLVD